MTQKGEYFMITLYSTNCPRCMVLEKKLNNAGIEYVINNNVDEMLSLGFMQAPILMADNKAMNFKDAIDWIGEQIGN